MTLVDADRTAPVGAPVATPPGQRRTGAAARRRRVGRVALEVLGFGLAAGLVWWDRRSLAAAVASASRASPVWLVLAAAAEAVAMASFAREQRRLVGPGPDGPIRWRSALATTYAGNALAVALPLAGSGLSAAFTFRRYVSAGAPAARVVTGLAVSWALSTATFTLVLASAAAGTGQTALLVTGALGGVASVAVVAGLLVALRSRRARSWLAGVAVPALSVLQRVARRPAGQPVDLVETGLDRLAATRLRVGDLGAAAGFALVLWTADIACLACSLQAVGAPLSVPRLVLAWSVGVGANSLSLTPGGIGLVEAALTAALVATGLPATTALAGVLLYRLISFWLVTAVGAVLLGHHHRTALPLTH